MKIKINAIDSLTYVIELKQHSNINIVQDLIVHINVNDIISIDVYDHKAPLGKMNLQEFIDIWGVNGTDNVGVRFITMSVREKLL